ncbi:S-layer homology domain-containing protein [Paenibacillus sp. MMS18-CY102]|uniref:S-layer homology domain-containing protein n=1 Tax=Paenibacillus sp. MMS18-CY102 TaxID=2682849 RepID=UPI0013652E45|nr:hypothetical protein [Paenibacillus sp. MMS18-CY102]
MVKKLGLWLMVFAMIVTLLPLSSANHVNAATGNFNFLGESDDPLQPRVTSDERVTLDGTVTNVNASTITYDVVQVVNTNGNSDPVDDQLGQKRENITSNIYVNGFNIQIYNLQLFPGLNRITFKGVQGGGFVSNSIYIDYRNGPVMYNLVASLDGNQFPMKENETTVVQSTTSRGRSSADISISGNAPNAQKVTVIVNNSSRTYEVNSSNGYSFAASPINVLKGKNLVTIKVQNGSQTVETTREIAFYNGDVTFYDVKMSETSTTTEPAELAYSPTFLVNTLGNLVIKGKVIVPNKYYDDTPTNNLVDPVPHPNPADPLLINYQLTDKTGGTVTGSVYTPLAAVGNPSVKDPFFVYEYNVPTSGLAIGKTYQLDLKAFNQEKGLNEGTNALFFTLASGTNPYFYQVNYLPGYKINSPYEQLTGKALEGQNLYELPFAVEVLVGNVGNSLKAVTPTKVTDIVGKSVNLTATDYTTKTLVNNFVTRTVNGVPQTFQRIVIEFKNMPFEGTQTISLDLSSGVATKDVKFTLLFGPYATYKKVFDKMEIQYDSTDANPATTIVQNALGSLEGEFLNIANPADIRYDSSAGAQTVFMYVNNTQVKLKQNGSGDATKFIANSTTEVMSAMFPGENKIRIVFQGAKNSYEKTISVYLIPTNLPVIPVPNSLGVFPYGNQQPKPLPNDPDFTLNGSVYNTTRDKMNIYGTFDFIDLGKTIGEVTSRLSTLVTTTSGVTVDKAKDYILKVDSPVLKSPVYWDLNTDFTVVTKGTNGEDVFTAVARTGRPNDNLSVFYDADSQSFYFILKNQELNADGTPSVYNFYAYNSGEAGPRASYRLEVDPTAIPYSIIRPILPAKQIVNQNFVEIIISAPGAKTVTINKQTAEKLKYDSDNDGKMDYEHAFRVYVQGLKAGKNSIKFEISSGTDKTTGAIDITYAPTNVPGAGFMTPMASTHKVFDGAINLKFEKGTTLIRTDYNVPAQYKNQVFTGHSLLFGIANSEDGVVDRHEFETLPSNFDSILQSFGTRFKVSFPTRFTKASSTYWIDAGMADDLTTGAYDPLKMGADPYQFPGATGPGGTSIPTYDMRPGDRELLVSKPGTLTLTFDKSMVNEVGTLVTVFRYDIDNKYWENMGGVVDTSKNTITVPFRKFGYYVVGKMVYSFTDMTAHPYARNYLEAIFSKGVMNAAGFDEFGADLYVTRGEFARMVVKALDIPLNYELSKPHFDDVPAIINPDALWDYRYVETAAREGIIRGTQPRTFEPNSYLTREEAAVILARARELKLETDTNKINATLQKTFKDYGNVTFYARASVIAIAKKGYIQGSLIDPNNKKSGYVFEPKSNLLRSDASIIVGKMLADLKRLPKING